MLSWLDEDPMNNEPDCCPWCGNNDCTFSVVTKPYDPKNRTVGEGIMDASCNKEFANFTIPQRLYEQFIQFLNVSQAVYTSDHLQDMTDEEKDLILFVEQLVELHSGEKPAMRYATQEERLKASDDVLQIMNRLPVKN